MQGSVLQRIASINKQLLTAALLLACCTGTAADPLYAPSIIQTFSATNTDIDTDSASFLTQDQNLPTQTNWLPVSNQLAGSIAASTKGSEKGSEKGFAKHRLSDGRKLVGWKLSETLYFGRAKKEGATVSLVWEKTADQRLSVSTDGIKFTRRFR